MTEAPWWVYAILLYAAGLAPAFVVSSRFHRDKRYSSDAERGFVALMPSLVWPMFAGVMLVIGVFWGLFHLLGLLARRASQLNLGGVDKATEVFRDD